MTQRVVNYTYGTGNPVLPDGSIDVRDGIDNLQSVDVFMNAPEDTYNQRDGEVVRTVAGMNNEFDAQILNMGFTRVGTFASGATITNPRQTLLWDVADGGDGQEYGWSGSFPPAGKVAPPGSTPLTTGGIAVGAWISRFDPSLRVQARGGLRRSYAEAGYNLVAGSFEAGGVLATSNDVLLHEASGKAFSGPAGTVSADTNPTSGGFTDRSGVLLRDRLYLLESFWVAADIDWTNAFERASQASKNGGFVVQCPPGILTVSDSVVLYTDTSSKGGEFYKAKGSRFVGHPRGTTVKKTAVGTKPINATVYLQGGRGLQWTGIDIIDESANSYGIYGSVDVSFSEFKNLFISTKNWGMYFNNPVYVAVDIDNIVFAASATRAMQHALRIPGGTTYRVGNIAAFGITGDAYFLSGSYVEIGPLACDDCAGVPYTFSQLDGSISALGVENIGVPSAGTVIKVTSSSSINVDVMFLFSVVQPANTSLIDYNAFGRIKIESIRGDGATVLNGRLITAAGGGTVEVSYLNKTPAQDSIGQFNIGNVAGAQYIQRYGNSEYKYLRMPEAPQNDATVRYRIMGELNSAVGCIGSIVEARGGGAFPRSAMYDINCIGSGSTQYALRIKKAVSETSSNNYNAWFTAVYQGATYVLCQLDTNGTRNLGSYFNGIVNGTDQNLFKVVEAADVTSLAAFAGGVVKTETAS